MATDEIFAVGKLGDPMSFTIGNALALFTLYNLPDCVPTNNVVEPAGECFEKLTCEKGTVLAVPRLISDNPDSLPIPLMRINLPAFDPAKLTALAYRVLVR